MYLKVDDVTYTLPEGAELFHDEDGGLMVRDDGDFYYLEDYRVRPWSLDVK